MKHTLTLLLLFICISGFPQATPISDGLLGNIGDGMIGGVGNAKNAANYGFLPTATMQANVAAWNSIPVGGTIVVTVPGTYEIDSTLWLYSNTTYRFSHGVKIKKMTNHVSGLVFSHVFANHGMITGQRDSNIKLYGDTTEIIPNGVDNYSHTNTRITPIFRLRANIQLYKVDNFVISGLMQNDINVVNQYFFCTVDCNYGTVDKLVVTSYKDGIDIISSSYITVTNCKIYTGDDATFVGMGYAATTPVLKTCNHITFKDCEFSTSAGSVGNILVGSWGNWITGHTYQWNEACINNGKIYMKEDTGGDVASVAPTHTSGAVTGADGIKWWYVQDGTDSSMSVKNLVYKNITIVGTRGAFNMANVSTSASSEGTGLIDSLTLNNIIYPANYAYYYLIHSGNVGKVWVKNSTYVATAGGFLYSNVVAGQGKASFRNLEMDSCTYSHTSWFLPFISNASYTFSGITMQDCDITFSGANGKLFKVLAGCLDNATAINCTRTKFRSINWLWYPGAANLSSTLRLTDCQFLTSIAYVGVVVTYTGCNFDYISTGTAYINPISNLFFNNQASGALDINLSTSSGTITKALVRSSNLVTVTACDIPYD
jgi:hypothetical protein